MRGAETGDPDRVDDPGTIPEFDCHGNLPDGVYPCDELTLRARFVEPFPSSQTRQANYDGFMPLREDATRHGIVGTQWVDGSFVTSKPAPGDVDLVTFCDYDFLNRLSQPAQAFVRQCVAGRAATQARYRTHTFLVASCNACHPHYPVFESCRAYWRKWFGTTRGTPNPAGPDLPGRPKGFVQMALADPANAPIIRAERSQA